MKKRKRHNYEVDKDRLKLYSNKSIIKKMFLDDEYIEEDDEEMLYRYKYAKFVTNPDSYLKG